MSGILEAVRRVNLPGRVERSIRLRVVVLLAVLLATASTAFSEAAPREDAAAAFLLLPVGAWVSWTRAGKPNFLLKGMLAVGAMFALSQFFTDVRAITAVEAARRPLASLFLAVQVLHGFDLPARRDLGFTLASSLTLAALSAANTYEMWFLVVLVVYGMLGVVAMLEMQRSGARERADDWSVRDELALLSSASAKGPLGEASAGRTGTAVDAMSTRGDLRSLAKVAGTVVVLGALAFSVVPRASTTQLGGLQFRSLPFQVPIPSGLIDNPGLTDGGRNTPVEGQPALDYNPAAYFGFAQNVDLRTVGTPSDLPVLRVRADRPRLWRGMVFDTYTGIGWTRPDEKPVSVQGNPVELGEPEDLALRQRVVQTIELMTDTPNLIFAASEVSELFVGGPVEPWSDGTLSTPASLAEGVVYSVVSWVDITPRAELRVIAPGWDPAMLSRWTQLPETVPDRVHALAAELTAEARTPYAAAEAIQAWIGSHTEYRLDAVPPPLTGDVVDHFLFESRQGWCEPIASSMVVLLRSAGIPARFATGFQPGTRNPVTGVFDVALKNAHAWVEVNIPSYGWIAFDPTGAVPLAVAPEAHRSIPLLDLFAWLREQVPAPVRATLATVAQRGREQWPALTVFVVAAGVGAVALRRRRAAARLALLPPFAQLEHHLGKAGLHRDGGQTPRQFIDEVTRRRPGDRPALATLLAHEESRRYGADPVEDEAVSLALVQVVEATKAQARLR